MSIDIDKLSEADLIDLNHPVVERLRFMRDARAHVAMLQFRIGERVSFQPDGRERIFSIVVRYNKKSVTVITSDSHPWKVSQSLLTAENASSEVHAASGNIVRLARK